MSKLIVGFIWVVLAFQAQGQTVIKRCSDGSTVGGNSSCPSSSSGNRAPVYKKYDVYGAIVADLINERGVITSSSRWQGVAAAKKGALDQCHREIGKGDNCEVLLTFKNTCGTVAVLPEDSPDGKTIWAGGTGATEVEAMDNAAAACNKKAASAGITKKNACGIWIEAFCARDDRY